MIREEIKKLTEKAIKDLYDIESDVDVESTTDSAFGDYSANVAMILKKSPQEIADIIKSDVLDKVEVKNGFINFFISKGYLQDRIKDILKEKDKFGQVQIGENKKVNIEFISANPTGPLTLANGRGGFCGDVLANVLDKAGYKVTGEYYINDAGGQIKKLGHSVLHDELAEYKGKFYDELQGRIKDKDPEIAGKKAVEIIMKEEIKPDIKKIGIKFDKWFSEQALRKGEKIDQVIKELEGKGLIYNNEGAKWFRSTNFGDDKDRVLIKSDGEKTYFATDIVYLKNKIKRGFDVLILFFGADHYGYIGRIKAAAEALGFNKNNIRFMIMQMVQLLKEGKEMRMSKRTGTYVVLKELVDEVGLDVARYFFLMRAPESHLIFNLDLAKEQSDKNPVFYIQYAYARICSILRKVKIAGKHNLELLTHDSEMSLIKQLIKFPEVVEDTAKDYQVQRLPRYATELAESFHAFYRDCRVITEDKSLQEARLALVLATKNVLKNTLDLMGISAPEKM
jgi:arginyl-tRNA synthetase